MRFVHLFSYVYCVNFCLFGLVGCYSKFFELGPVISQVSIIFCADWVLRSQSPPPAGYHVSSIQQTHTMIVIASGGRRDAEGRPKGGRREAEGMPKGGGREPKSTYTPAPPSPKLLILLQQSIASFGVSFMHFVIVVML